MLALVIVVVVAFNVLAMGLRKAKFDHVRYDQKFLDVLGIRHLTFNNKSDVAIAVGLVAAFLAAIVLTSPK
jgi:multisubunit Na+/H+ antiporter MnhB subunit